MPRDEVVILLGIARDLKHAATRAQTRNYKQSQRLTQRMQVMDRRIRKLNQIGVER